MLIHHMYGWNEAIAQTGIMVGRNILLHHLSVDVLLPGPTSLGQIECVLCGGGNKKLSSNTNAPAINCSSSSFLAAFCITSTKARKWLVTQQKTLDSTTTY